MNEETEFRILNYQRNIENYCSFVLYFIAMAFGVGLGIGIISIFQQDNKLQWLAIGLILSSSACILMLNVIVSYSYKIAYNKIMNKINKKTKKEKKDKVFKTSNGSFRLDQIASVKDKEMNLIIKTIQGEEFIIYNEQTEEFKRRYYK